MRTHLPASLALTALLAACGEPAPAVPSISDVSSQDADAAVSLVARSEILADAEEYDMADRGQLLDFGGAPEGFKLTFETDGGIADSGEGTADTGTASYSNYAAGVLAAAGANLITASVVLPPAIGIGVVSQGEITQIDTNVWQAVNTIPLGGQDVTGTFTVAWVGIGWLAEMRLTTEDGDWSDDVWFDGFLAYGGGVGWWDLYDHGALVGVVEWLADGQGNAQFGIAAVGGEHAGAGLNYVFADSGFARIDAVDPAGAHAWVQHNPDDSGEVRLPEYNGGARSCWASDFTDVTCP